MAGIRFELLGTPRVGSGARQEALGLRKAAELVAYLALTARAHPRAHLTELLWPNAPAGVGRARLRRLIHRVATVAGADPFVAVGDALALHDDVVTDVHEFAVLAAADDEDSLQRAAVLYSGDLLAGHGSEAGDGIDRWIAGEARRLRASAQRVFTLLAERAHDAGDHAACATWSGRCLDLDPCDEHAHARLVAAYAAQGMAAAAAAQYRECVRVLDAELGVAPGFRPDESTRIPLPETRYVASGDAYIAYQVIGDGPVDMLFLAGFVSHVEHAWAEPLLAGFLERLARGRRLILLDRRGVGLSDRVCGPPTLESTIADVHAVLDAVGSQRAVLFGNSEAGPIAVEFAARYPERVQALVLHGTMAKGVRGDDYPFTLPRAAFDRWLGVLVAGWGGPIGLDTFAPTAGASRQIREWWARMLRLSSSPGSMRAVLEALRDIDVREALPRVAAPTLVTHRRGDLAVPIAAGRHLADSIPGARFVELEGDDHWPWHGDADAVLRAVDRFAPASCV